MNNIIIDTDPGVDDAFAIAMACYGKLQMIGITTVFGNSSIQNTTRNACAILSLVNSKVPVYRGAARPIYGIGKHARSHGSNGLGGYVFNSLPFNESKETAMQFFSKVIASVQQFNIVCIGPSTNIALALMKIPDFDKKIENLILLGGEFSNKGNITSFAEFNVYNDPYAFKIVLENRCRKIIIPIDVCRQVVFQNKDFDEIRSDDIKLSFQKIARAYIHYYRNDKKYGGFYGGVMYDLLAVAYVLDPNLFSLQPVYVRVDTRRGKFYGRTLRLKRKKPNCLMVKRVDPEGVKELFFKMINGSKK